MGVLLLCDDVQNTMQIYDILDFLPKNQGELL